MKKLLLLLPVILAAALSVSFSIPRKKTALLVFSRTTGFRHASIAQGKQALQALAAANNFKIDTTEDPGYFTTTRLSKYAAIIFLNTTGDILNEEQQLAFEKYIRSGKGFVGIHAATDTEYDWPWFAKMVGANFESHPKTQKAKLVVIDARHPSTKHLPAVWERTDEWYNFKNQNSDVKVVLKIDEASYEGGKNGSDHPMAWHHEYDGGRAFYTALGHTPESYSDPLFIQHVLGGIRYVTNRQ